MKYLRFLIAGVFFGIILTKAEVISWYRINEMFHFESFHMYGVIGSAVALGVLLTQWIKRSGATDINGKGIRIIPKERGVPKNLLGGIIFGMGWAMTGACPGPMYILVGNGFLVILVVIASALLGTFTYGLLKDKLPH